MSNNIIPKRLSSFSCLDNLEKKLHAFVRLLNIHELNDWKICFPTLYDLLQQR